MKPRRRSRPGRPTAWTADTALMVGYGLGRGLPLDLVAKTAGLSRSTLYARINDGALGDERFQRLAQLIDERERFGESPPSGK